MVPICETYWHTGCLIQNQINFGLPLAYEFINLVVSLMNHPRSLHLKIETGIRHV